LPFVKDFLTVFKMGRAEMDF